MDTLWSHDVFVDGAVVTSDVVRLAGKTLLGYSKLMDPRPPQQFLALPPTDQASCQKTIDSVLRSRHQGHVSALGDDHPPFGGKTERHRHSVNYATPLVRPPAEPPRSRPHRALTSPLGSPCRDSQSGEAVSVRSVYRRLPTHLVPIAVKHDRTGLTTGERKRSASARAKKSTVQPSRQFVSAGMCESQGSRRALPVEATPPTGVSLLEEIEKESEMWAEKTRKLCANDHLLNIESSDSRQEPATDGVSNMKVDTDELFRSNSHPKEVADERNISVEPLDLASQPCSECCSDAGSSCGEEEVKGRIATALEAAGIRPGVGALEELHRLAGSVSCAADVHKTEVGTGVPRRQANWGLSPKRWAAKRLQQKCKAIQGRCMTPVHISSASPESLPALDDALAETE